MNDTSPFEALLFPYSMLTWLCWIVLLFLAGWGRRWRGIVLGELAVATTIFLLKLRWIEDTIQFERNQKTAIDRYFFVGFILSALAVAVVLFPVGVMGLLIGSRNARVTENQPPPLPRGGN